MGKGFEEGSCGFVSGLVAVRQWLKIQQQGKVTEIAGGYPGISVSSPHLRAGMCSSWASFGFLTIQQPQGISAAPKMNILRPRQIYYDLIL